MSTGMQQLQASLILCLAPTLALVDDDALLDAIVFSGGPSLATLVEKDA